MEPAPASAPPSNDSAAGSWGQRLLGRVEWLGNQLPDPAVLFLLALLLTWVFSAVLAPVAFRDPDPRTVKRDAAGNVTAAEPIRVKNQLAGESLVAFTAKMVKTFVEFPPLGVVLVALLGLGVAEHTGFIHAALRQALQRTPRKLLTPALLLAAIVSHSAADVGYVLVIPLGGVVFAAAGRHPLAGIAAAFAGVSGGFSANFLPSALDPLLQGFTQSAAQIIEPGRLVNPLCNWYFTGVSSVFIVLAGWYLTDRVIEPRLRGVALDAAPETATGAEGVRMGALSAMERRGLLAAFLALGAGVAVLAWTVWPTSSPWRSKSGELAGHGAPLMEAIVPLIFVLSLLPGVAYGWAAGTVKSHRDIVKGMSASMSTMGYYLVLAFCAALFTYAFRESNLGALLSIKGATLLKALALPPKVTIVGIVLLAALTDVLVGSASAKWAVLAPILVPMLMQAGISPELTQAAYRIGDSTTNIITPLMPYFPLVVVYTQRYLKRAGIGTLVSLMLPYSITFLAGWTVLLLVYWSLGLPLGLQAGYTHP